LKIKPYSELIDSLSRASRRMLRRKVLDVPKDKLGHVLVSFNEKLHKHTRFSLWFKFLVLLPTFMWLILFKSYVEIPISLRPKIDVTTLPTLESFILFGHTLLKWPRGALPEDHVALGALDLLAAFVYLIHFAFAWIVALGLYVYHRKKTNAKGQPVPEPWTFLLTLGLLNLFAVITQISWPTAPPWYVEQYGVEQEANYETVGDEAGLARVDQLLRFGLFRRLYGQSPIVFGSFPSLHAAWPIAITIFAPEYKVAKLGGTLYIATVWWAAMYLNHHFLVDLLGGAVFTAFSYFVSTQSIALMTRHMKHKIYSRGCLKWVLTGEKGKDVELVVIDMPDCFEENDAGMSRTPQRERSARKEFGEPGTPLLKEH
jgi:hypothetical protein